MIHLLWLSLAVPVVIHLVHRRKARRVLFSTLRFLQMVDQRVARRQRLKELLLLAVRLLLLGALIGALYRPMIHSATFKGANVPTTAVIVLDNTCSMRAAAQGVLRFGRAKQAVQTVLEGLRAGDSAALILVDGPEDDEATPTTALNRLREQARETECGFGAATAAGALRRAVEALRASQNPRKELYVVSDFQRAAWAPALEGPGPSLPADVPVFLVDVGQDVETNLSVAEAEFGLGVQVAGVASELYCTVRNPGRVNAERELTLELAGEKVAAQKVALAAGAEITAAFTHIFERTGDVAAAVRLEADELAPDNARYLALSVSDRLPVLLVDGDPSSVPFLDETFYLETALEAPAAGGRTLSPIQTRTVAADDFLKQRLKDYACVALANVGRVPDLWAERLRRYVLEGGGLIVFAGDRVDPASYNTALAAAGQEVLLPALLAEVREAGEEEAFRVSRIDAAHPVWRGLAEQVDLSAARVERCFAVQPHRGGPDAAVLAELDDGPLLLEVKAGSGTVILCTTSADLDWSNLPARPFFLPLVHQMAYYAGRPLRRVQSVAVGMPWTLELPPSEQPVEVSFYGPRADGEDDEEPVAVMTAERGGPIVFGGTSRPGVYRAEFALDGRAQSRLFAVNVDPAESDLTAADPEELAGAFGGAVARTVREPAKLAALVRRERTGLPLWDYLFALAIALAVAESFVGNVTLRH